MLNFDYFGAIGPLELHAVNKVIVKLTRDHRGFEYSMASNCYTVNSEVIYRTKTYTC
jgi:hypothetical protein